MGVATAFSSARMAAIEAKALVSAAIAGDNLTFTRNNGETFSAGNVRGPQGPKGDGNVPWRGDTNYVVNDTVGYAGRIWRALGPSVNKPPALNTFFWRPVMGGAFDSWAEDDPTFAGDDYATGWEFFWQNGGVTRVLTKLAGEVDSGLQAMKINLPVNASQRWFQRDENIVRGGEFITVTIRAKKVESAGTATVNATLVQNATGYPEPFNSETAVASAGAQELTTSYQTYTFTFTTLPGKPRAKIHFFAVGGAVATTVLIDRAEVRRQQIPPVISNITQTIGPSVNPIPATLANYTVFYWSSGPVVPVGAKIAHITLQWSCTVPNGNAAANWQARVRKVAPITGAQTDLTILEGTGHNNGSGYNNIGQTVTYKLNVEDIVGGRIDAYVNGANHAGSSGPAYFSNAVYSVSFTN